LGGEKLSTIIKSGDEIVKEFFEQIRKDESLDSDTKQALLELQKEGNFKRPRIKKKLDFIRESALEEYDKAQVAQD
jgi:DNA polymerase III delta prime subunit